MKRIRYIWLLISLTGLLFVGAAFASDTTTVITSETYSAVVIGQVDDCDDEPSPSALIGTTRCGTCYRPSRR
jgi:hypothetical protein